MKRRCYTKSDSNYIRYGAKGIEVCNDWHTYLPFRTWAINHGYKKELSIDRIDNKKGYLPSNCRWTTRTEQMRNMTSNKLNMKKAQDILLSFRNGERAQNIAQKYSIDVSMIYKIKSGECWSNENTPE